MVGKFQHQVLLSDICAHLSQIESHLVVWPLAKPTLATFSRRALQQGSPSTHAKCPGPHRSPRRGNGGLALRNNAIWINTLGILAELDTDSGANRTPVGAKRRGSGIMSGDGWFGSTLGVVFASMLLSG